MRNAMFVFVLFLAQSVGAQILKDQIHSIRRGTDGEPHLIKFQSGLVKFLEASETSKLQELEISFRASRKNENVKMLTLEESNFEPTLIPDSSVNELFNRLNPYMRRKSECSDRAHVWTWDEYQRSGTKSEKAFLMLTDTYIKKHRYKWWFHVAPLFTTTSGKKIVMDYQFLDRPVEFSTWKNLLVFSKRDCVTDFRFLDYDAGADQAQDCYVKFEPMYSYIPGDIGARELGRPVTDWNSSQINSARSRAFFKGIINEN